jgi:hypothetical protein
MISEPRTCAHHPCRCVVPDGMKFCSDSCQQAPHENVVPVALDMAVCICGHAGCAHRDQKAAPVPDLGKTDASASVTN